ncbi:MAG TPA: N-acetylmuramoyl-L-alanine amidase [Gaiellaceae bacterium]|nr:N-acetylmuramoyl-L-alanine amidase [Gaiellaceae bacterium]
MGLRRVIVLAAAVAASSVVAPAAGATAGARPPVVWLKGSGNFTQAHRPIQSVDRIVVHVTEGSFWGSVHWLKNPRAHASSHYVVSRRGKIVQLVHLSDIAWHAGHWGTNERSVGIEHEGFTYGPHGFAEAQYHASAKLAAWIARRSLMPITRQTFIGHHEVPDGRGGRGGSSHHTDPGPRWNWNRYLRLVRRYAGIVRLSVKPLVPEGPLRGIVSWRAKASPDIKRVEFIVDGRVVHVDHRRPFAYALNTAKLANRAYKLQVHGIAGPGRYDVEGQRVVVDNKTFALTSAGARPWMRAPKTIRLRVRPWGQKAARMVFTVDGKRRAVDSRPPFLFSWSTARAKPGKHVLEVVATSIDGRVVTRRIPVVVPAPPPKPKPKPVPKPVPLAIAGQSIVDGQEANGLVVWRVDVRGKADRVEFLVDGVSRGADVAAPYTFGWHAAAEQPGEHRLTARVHGRDGKVVERTVTVTVSSGPEHGGSATP